MQETAAGIYSNLHSVSTLAAELVSNGKRFIKKYLQIGSVEQTFHILSTACL